MIKVQIADDNIEFAVILANYLTKDNEIKVVAASLNGEDAVNAYLETRPDVLLLDLDMPQKNGVEVLNILCNISPEERNNCNILILSGRYDAYIFEYTSKVYACLSKPCELDIILRKIKDVYQNSISTKQSQSYRQNCKELFLKLGCNLSNTCTTLLMDSVVLLLENPKEQCDIKKICRALSQKHGITEKNIKWDIEYATRSISDLSSIPKLKSIFPEYDESIKLSTQYLLSLATHTISKNP